MGEFTVPVILRVLMYLFFLIYQGWMFFNMWHLDAMRSKHSILNLPDAVSNIRWLRMVVVGMMCIVVAYLLFVFIPSLLVLGIYSVVLASVFIYFIYNALARPMYEEAEGWKDESETADTVVEPETALPAGALSPSTIEKTDDTPPVEEVDPLIRIDQWLETEKPFCRAEFSLSDIMNRFADLDRETLTELLQKRGENPQSYIRRYRIEEACRIISSEKEIKVAELALRVGFSHTSSISRAFTAVMGETVTSYMTKVGAKRKSKYSRYNLLIF